MWVSPFKSRFSPLGWLDLLTRCINVRYSKLFRWWWKTRSRSPNRMKDEEKEVRIYNGLRWAPSAVCHLSCFCVCHILSSVVDKCLKFTFLKFYVSWVNKSWMVRHDPGGWHYDCQWHRCVQDLMGKRQSWNLSHEIRGKKILQNYIDQIWHFKSLLNYKTWKVHDKNKHIQTNKYTKLQCENLR